jgi:two-component system nitrogen regulation response regulator GlnG
MRAFRDRVGPAPIVVITAFGSLETAVRAMEGGAFEYLVKPFDLDQATSVVKRALESGDGGGAAPAGARPAPGSETLIGTSPPMQELFKTIALVAPTDVPVLITGESGTGKDLVARAIHRHSARRAGPFLPVCLATLSPGLIERELFGHVKGSFTGAVQDRKGLLELADGGTVFLDEIGDVPPGLQVKLLRAIEHREVTPVGDARPRATDIRVIAATNRPLDALMAAGQFREDLFFRLSVFQVRIPPLRDRLDDIPALAEYFLRQPHLPPVSGDRLATDVLDALRARPWPGNVRELRNAVEHAAIVARGHGIRPAHFPLAPTSTPGPPSPSDDGRAIEAALVAWTREQARRPNAQHPDDPPLYERFLALVEPPVLRAVLEQCRNNRAAAAQWLGIHRATLRQKLRRYGIDPPPE